jgi:4-hydroxybenzoate polyprenyltransferase
MLSHPYLRLLRLDKPIGILLLLWPTLWGLWFAAGGLPPLHILLIFSAGVVLMRSAGCAVNDYADRDFDAHVERTRRRPLATGEVSSKEALLLAGGLALLAFLLILPLNRLVILLAFPALFLAASYPFTKRFFAIPQAYLGVAFGFGIPMAYAAVRGEVPVETWLLLLANLFWSVAYDTEYAMVDRHDDIKIGIRTSAITFGGFDIAAIASCYAATLGLLGYVGAQAGLGPAFYGGLLAAAGIALYHLWLIRGRERAACFKAFLHNTWFGFAVFAGLAIDRFRFSVFGY